MHHSRSGKKRFVTEILLHALKFKCKATAIADLCTSGEAWRLKSNLLQAISWQYFLHWTLQDSGIFEVFKFMVRSAQSDKPGVK